MIERTRPGPGVNQVGVSRVPTSPGFFGVNPVRQKLAGHAGDGSANTKPRNAANAPHQPASYRSAIIIHESCQIVMLSWWGTMVSIHIRCLHKDTFISIVSSIRTQDWYNFSMYINASRSSQVIFFFANMCWSTSFSLRGQEFVWSAYDSVLFAQIK
jgi:hypothetical protein